jgi:hypothetical protein
MFGHDTLMDAKVLKMDELDKYETSNRSPVDLEVTVFCHGFPCATGKANEIGPTGLCIEIDPFPIAKNTYMEVQFTMYDDKGEKLYRLPVYVGEKGDHEMELLFVNTYVSAFHYVNRD